VPSRLTTTWTSVSAVRRLISPVRIAVTSQTPGPVALEQVSPKWKPDLPHRLPLAAMPTVGLDKDNA